MKILCEKKTTFHSLANKSLIKSSKNNIYQDDTLILTTHSIMGQINSLVRRLSRNEIFYVEALDQNLYIAVLKKKILIFKKNKPLKEIKIRRGNRPLRNGIIYMNERILYGDYWRNRKRLPVNIYSINPISNEKKVIIQFKGIRHIHFIQKDETHKNSLLIGTGDRDDECGIYRYDLAEKKITTIGKGSQNWRALSIIQIDDYLYWGTDCPDQQNFIFRYHRKKKKLSKLHQIAGPAYYSTVNKNKTLIIGTTIENRKKHKACIYISDNGTDWKILAEYKKDMWHGKLFGYGIIEFIKGQAHLQDLLVNLKALKK
jgi:hypothetical protein